MTHATDQVVATSALEVRLSVCGLVRSDTPRIEVRAAFQDQVFRLQIASEQVGRPLPLLGREIQAKADLEYNSKFTVIGGTLRDWVPIDPEVTIADFLSDLLRGPGRS